MKRSQLGRVLDAARRYNGVSQSDFAHPVCDGGPPITRVGARVQEAEDRLGCVFEIIGWRSKTRVFRLVSEPDAEVSRREHPSSGRTVAAPTADLDAAPVLSGATAHWRDL